MHLGRRETEEEAIRIAKRFVAENGGAEWTCGGAKPDVLEPGYKRRKTVIKWVVLFDASSRGRTVDGPIVVMVNIETKQAKFF